VILLLYGIFFFTLGGIFGEGLLIALALLFLLFIFSCRFIGRMNMRGLNAEIRMKERIYAGKSFESTVYIDNKKKWWSSHSIEVKVGLLHGQKVHGNLKWLGSHDGAKLKQRVSIPHRGEETSFKLQMYSSFPFGVFEHIVKEEIFHNLIVYPRLIVPLEIMNYGSVNDSNPLRGYQLGETNGEIRGVRVWQPGDPAKRIHWPASAKSIARGQGLRVREFDPPGFAPESCTVLFHSYAEQGELYRSDRFERATSLAAGVLHYLHSRNLRPKFTADFLNWSEIECFNRRNYIELLAILAQAKRSIGTMQHELQNVLDKAAEEVDQVIIVSDMDPDTWGEGVTIPKNGLVIDIRQMKFSGRMKQQAS